MHRLAGFQLLISQSSLLPTSQVTATRVTVTRDRLMGPDVVGGSASLRPGQTAGVLDARANG
jgi:hypothetical protein